MKKIAVVLLNLGGPDRPESINGFLFNLFYDRAIINLPNPLRWIVAKLIAYKRKNEAMKIYNSIGGRSPILSQTEAQAKALELALAKQKKFTFRVFIAMRYWHPFSCNAIENIREFSADEVLLVPLYPQFSITTTKSSVEDFVGQFRDVPVKTLCCYYDDTGFVRAHAEQIKKLYCEVKNRHQNFKLLFSAHSLPRSTIEKGDPYQWQIEQTVGAVMVRLQELNLDHEICYQSKVGPMAWLEPSTEEAIMRSCKQGCAIIIVPIAFVSEHSETLYELDILYKELAVRYGAEGYYRVKALATNKIFIDSLARLSLGTANSDKKSGIDSGATKICSKEFCCFNRRGV